MNHHRTVARTTKILELVGQQSGMSLADLTKALDAPKGSVHVLLRGLVETGWLNVEKHRYYLGPAIYAVGLLSDHGPGRYVTHESLFDLHEKTKGRILVGVPSADSFMYVDEVGSRPHFSWWTKTGIMRPLVSTAAGKVVLAFMAERDRNRILNQQYADYANMPQLLNEMEIIRKNRIARNDMIDNHVAFAVPILTYEGNVSATITMVLDKSEGLTDREIDVAVNYLDQLARSYSRDEMTGRDPIKGTAKRR